MEGKTPGMKRVVLNTILWCVVFLLLISVPWKVVWRKAWQAFGMYKGVVFMSDLSMQAASQDIGVLQRDRNFLGKTISLTGKKYSRGLGTHANSEIVYELDKKYSCFKADIGIDDTEGPNHPGSVVFKVFVDGEKAYESPVMRWDSAPMQIKIDVDDKQELKLIVTDAGDNINNDQAVWADAKLCIKPCK